MRIIHGDTNMRVRAESNYFLFIFSMAFKDEGKLGIKRIFIFFLKFLKSGEKRERKAQLTNFPVPDAAGLIKTAE